MLKDFPDALVGLGRALEVLLGTNLLANILSLYMLEDAKAGFDYITDLLWGNGLLGSLVKLLNGLLVETKILLAANEDDRETLAEMQNLGDPLQFVSGILCRRGHVSYLLLDVVERVRRIDGEADQDDVRVGVGEGAETVVIFLASSIPEGELNVLAIDLNIGDVVLEDGRDIDL